MLSILHAIKNIDKTNKVRPMKSICKLMKLEDLFINHDPQIDLKVVGYLLSQVIVDFGSQRNVLPKKTYRLMGRPHSVKSNNYLTLLS